MENIKIFFLKAAYLLGKQSKCVSHQVGAIIAKNGRIISTGYNGTPPKFTNCCDVFDKNNFDREAHHVWSKMYEVHAEMNAIAFSARYDIGIEGAEMYTILQPCDDCLKNMIAAGIKKIYYVFSYDKAGKNNKLWETIEHEQVKNPDLINWIKNQENDDTKD